MYKITTVNLMNLKNNRASISILGNKKEIKISKDQNKNSSSEVFSTNFWGQGPEKDDLTFFDLKTIMNY